MPQWQAAEECFQTIPQIPFLSSKGNRFISDRRTAGLLDLPDAARTGGTSQEVDDGPHTRPRRRHADAHADEVLSIARTYGPVVARVIEPPCGAGRRTFITVRFEGQAPPFGRAGPCGVTSARGSWRLL